MSVGGVARLAEPWELYAGDDCGLRIVIRGIDGEPADLTDVTVRAAWRRSRSSNTAVELPVDVLDTPGDVLIRVDGFMTAVDTGLIRDGVFDVQVERDGLVSTVLTGKIGWVKDVTR